MKTIFHLAALVLLALAPVRAQTFLDCTCLATQKVMSVTACQAAVPDLCQFTECLRGPAFPPPPHPCSQTPLPGTIVGPGVHSITVTVTVPGLPPLQCLVPFTVTPGTAPLALVCAPDKTITNQGPWNFDPPAATNACCSSAGTPGGGVVISVVNTTTNGSCPRVFTRTWLATDECGQTATCTQTVTVPDRAPPNCPPFSMSVTGCPPRMPDFAALGIITDNCSPSNAIQVTQSIAPGLPLPLGQTVVILQLCDAAGNCRDCDVVITGVPGGAPPVLQCPPNQVYTTCGGGAVARFKPAVTGHVGPVVCVPPAGSAFPVGTNVVTCTATSACGVSSSCSFQVVVKNHLLGPPDTTYWGGLPDNYAGASETANINPCILSAFQILSWKDFDDRARDHILGHRFTGLPNNVVKAQLVMRMKPSTSVNTVNDAVVIGLGPNCTNTGFVYTQYVKDLPGAVPPTGGNWIQTFNGSTTFTLELGTLNPALITKINSDQFLDVIVEDDTTVDYMALRLWRCPPPSPGIGIPFDVVGGVVTALRAPAPQSGEVAPVLCVFPNPVEPLSGISLKPGAAQAITFTTVLDFTAPAGAGIDLVLPPDPLSPGEPPILSMRSKGRDGYCIKMNKKFADDAAGPYRAHVVNTNGALLDSLSFTRSEIQAEGIFDIQFLPGVENCHVTVELNCLDGSVAIEFAGPVAPSALRKGWDGCIYGPDRPVKKPKARVMMIPPRVAGEPPIEEVLLVASGYPEVVVEEPSITAMGRKWFDGHVILMKAYDDGETLRFTQLGAEGVLHGDLGHAANFELGLHHFENGDIPDEEQLFRVIGPIRGLTNRPAPPVLELRLQRASNNVACGIDFSPLQATGIRVELWSNGTLMAQGGHPAPVILPEDEFFVGQWPDRFAVAGSACEVRLFNAELFSIEGTDGGSLITIQGDEIRLAPELPAHAALPEYFSNIECVASEGMETTLHSLRRESAARPAALHLRKRPDLLTAEWDDLLDQSLTLQGAENPDGPWFNLGSRSPFSIAPEHRARFFRLIGD